MLEIPNLPHPNVPVGAHRGGQRGRVQWGETPTFDFEPLPHWELTERHGLVDFERGAKVAGAGFPFYIGKGARLQRALVQFFLDLAGEAGYTEMQPPLVVNEASGIGTGQIPDKEGQMYRIPEQPILTWPTTKLERKQAFRIYRQAMSGEFNSGSHLCTLISAEEDFT